MLFNYMTERVVQFFSGLEKQKSNKYYLNFDSEEDVSMMYSEMSKNPFAREFNYSNDNVFGNYKTIMFDINNNKIVIAAALKDKVSKDFLVTLRNTIGYNQYEEFSILFIFAGELDSLSRGAVSLMDHNMPLNINSVKHDLSQEISKKINTDLDKEIISILLEKTVEDYSSSNSSIFDMGIYLNIIQKQKIEPDDYIQFNMFPYFNHEENFDSLKLKDELASNEKYFSKVLRCHNFGNLDEIESDYMGNVRQSLKNVETWQKTPFNEVVKSHEQAMEKAKISYIDQTNGTGIYKSNEGLTIWDKPEKETVTGLRTRNIIVFNSEDLDVVSFDLKFNKNLQNLFLKKGVDIGKAIGKKIQVEIPKEYHNKFNYIEYAHEEKNSSKYEFKIIVLPVHQHILNSFAQSIKVYKPKKNDSELPTIELEANECILIGSKKESEVITDAGVQPIYNLDEGYFNICFTDEQMDDYVFLTFLYHSKRFLIKVNLFEKSDKLTINAATIFSNKLQNKESYVLSNDGSIAMGMNSFKKSGKELDQMLKIEQYIVDHNSCFVELIDGEIIDKKLRIPESIMEKYSELCEFFRMNNNIPLLMYWNEEFRLLIKEFRDLYFGLLSELTEGTSVKDDYKDMLLLGGMKYRGKVYFTSLSIVNLVYTDYLNENYAGAEFPSRFVDFINTTNSIPFFYLEDILYKSIENSKYCGWVEYQAYIDKHKETKYLSKIVKEKINQYVTHFKYMFTTKLAPVLSINLVQILDLDDFTTGLFDFFMEKIRNDEIDKIPLIELNIYSSAYQFSNRLELLNSIYDIDTLEDKLDYKFDLKEYDKRDVIKIIRDKIKIFVHHDKHDESFKKCHLCFTEMDSKVTSIESQMNKLSTGLYQGGLLPNVTITKDSNHYKIGFGTKLLDNDNEFINEWILLNEFALNGKADYKSDYKKGICVALDISDTKNYHAIFNTSDWVVFIAPDVDLSFFNEKFHDSFVLHYNDQYTNNSAYDAITLTKNIDKYSYVLRQHLNNNNFSNLDNAIVGIINSFNAINGEWLLKMIGNNSKYGYEKISIVAAVKQLIVSFSHPDFIWIPVSLEEILRVSGAVGLSGTNGIFSVKELDKNGSKSDDLLMIGFRKGANKTEIFFVPVEVKIGINSSNVINKAIEQVTHTFETIEEYLYAEEFEKRLQTEVLSHFFIQMALSSYKKLKSFEVLENGNVNFDEVLEDIINKRYSLSMLENLGKGIVLSFKKESGFPVFKRHEEIYLIELNEKIAFENLEKSVSDIFDKQKNNPAFESFNRDLYKECSYDLVDEEVLVDKPLTGIQGLIAAEVTDDTIIVNNQVNQSEEKEIKLNKSNKSMSLLIGTSEKYNENILWEFGNKGLQNRHLLITGSSGSGKTYAIQTLLYEVSRQNIPVVIFDYTDGFTQSQLVPEFIESAESQLEYHLVIKDKLGLNPFERYPMKIADFMMTEEPYQVALRLASTFKKVYSLGDQQYAAIYEAVKIGIEKKQDEFDLNAMIEYLKESDNKSAQTVISKIQPFVHSNIFDTSSDLNWEKIKNSSKIHIFQLSGYNREIQTLITELALWDLWNYFVMNGSENSPFVVVMDEAQNISHDESSASGKILTEGRKFGLSGWYATQFLRNSVSNDEIQRLHQSAHKLYFRPTDSGVDEVASYLSTDKLEISNWKKRLLSLKKGQCVSVGYEKKMNELKRSEPQIVNITSFEERIKKHFKDQ